MTWRVVWTAPAARDMRRLDREVARRIRAAVLRLVETKHGDVKRLHGYEREWRLRVGQWRVRFTCDPETGKVMILRVLPRSEAYRSEL